MDRAVEDPEVGILEPLGEGVHLHQVFGVCVVHGLLQPAVTCKCG